jgi:transposase-like protein
MVEESLAEHESRSAAIRSVAGKLGCTPETLRRWVRQDEIDQGKRPGVTSSDAERIVQLEREVRELRKVNEILKVASAFFAQAELDRRTKS